MPIEQFQKIPFAFYFSTFFDAGFVRNYPNNELNQRLTDTLIYAAGVGIDFVTFYDFVFRFEYSYNSERELNFRINIKSPI